MSSFCFWEQVYNEGLEHVRRVNEIEKNQNQEETTINEDKAKFYTASNWRSNMGNNTQVPQQTSQKYVPPSKKV